LALTEAEQVIQEDPSNWKAHILFGDAAVSKGEIKRGEESYGKVIALAPKEPVGYFRMGVLRRAQKKESEALTLFEKAMSLNPNLIDALSQIVADHLTKGDTQKALQRVSTQIESATDNPLFYHLRGRLHANRKKIKKAEADFKKSIDINPNYLAPYIDLGTLYSQEKQFDRSLDEAIKKNPKVPAAYMLRGVIFESNNDYEKAQTEYERVLEIDEAFAPAANNLAWIYAEHGGNIDRALTLAQIAKEKLPNNPSVSDTLGWIYVKKKAYLKAISLLKESAEKLGKHPEVRYHLGVAYYKNGDPAKAKKELEASLKLSANHPGADEARKVLGEL